MAADVVDCDVAIIGYGPVGATLAGLLAGRGVRTLVIDREVDIYPLPRAAHVDHEIMRIMQELVDRRSAMQRQLENASLALRSLRFDMVKLRTLGVGSAISDVTSATQEARALSLDIGRALEAADEVRKL